MYIAIGMTYEQFWEKESWLVKSYREAQKIKNKESNYFAWLNGVYVLQALQSGVPVMLTGIVKEKIKLPEFPKTPIDFDASSKEEQEKKQMELQKARMKEMAERFNAAFMKRQEAKAEKE
jgi:hypothetical protein